MTDISAIIKEKMGGRISSFEERSPRKIYLEFKGEDVLFFGTLLFKELGCRLITITAVDTPAALELLYHFAYDAQGKIITLRTFIRNKEFPTIESLAPMIKGADWIEREVWELFGITFLNHPNLTHLLLIDDWPAGKYPLRHDQKNGSPEKEADE
ncbi:MAG: NADH-quinone oxidoreductase subunit C [Candidatus Omnitrophota bacterium]